MQKAKSLRSLYHMNFNEEGSILNTFNCGIIENETGAGSKIGEKLLCKKYLPCSTR